MLRGPGGRRRILGMAAAAVGVQIVNFIACPSDFCIANTLQEILPTAEGSLRPLDSLKKDKRPDHGVLAAGRVIGCSRGDACGVGTALKAAISKRNQIKTPS